MRDDDFIKQKNESYQYESYTEKERGGCLTAFLGFAIFGNILGLILILTTFSSASRQAGGMISILIFALFAIQVGIFISVIGLWNWKRWGYNGMLAGYVIGLILNLITGSFASMGGSIIGIVLLTQLMKDKMELLE